jgi:hypothetical protein
MREPADRPAAPGGAAPPRRRARARARGGRARSAIFILKTWRLAAGFDDSNIRQNIPAMCLARYEFTTRFHLVAPEPRGPAAARVSPRLSRAFAVSLLRMRPAHTRCPSHLARASMRCVYLPRMSMAVYQLTSRSACRNSSQRPQPAAGPAPPSSRRRRRHRRRRRSWPPPAPTAEARQSRTR